MAADDESRKDAEKSGVARSDANTLLAGGFGIGAFGLISAAIGGAVCPVCVVAAPVLLGVGAYKRWSLASRRTRGTPPVEPEPSARRPKAG
jgi:hypothetical protein